MINLERLDPVEAERLAYAEGFEGVARVYARLADAEAEPYGLRAELKEREDECEALRAALYLALPFVEDCEDRPEYKRGYAAQSIRQIRRALGERVE